MLIDIELIDGALKELGKTNPGANLFRLTLAYVTPPQSRILEIGAGLGSVFTREKFINYKTLDFYSTEEVKAHFINDYGISGIENREFPTVDYVCKDGKLIESTCGNKFDLVFSSHAIEHQPCLLTHLKEVENVLDDNGAVAFIIPTRCCTFDALRSLSSTGDVISKYHSNEKVPSGVNVFEFYARHISLNPGRVVLNEDQFSYSFSIEDAYKKFCESIGAGGGYVDIHNWTFNPDSFVLIVIELYILGLINLIPRMATPVSGNEFMCILSKEGGGRGAAELAQLKEFRLILNKKLMLQDRA